MFTVEEICEEQERQYNRLMEEDDQYCHPESFKWGFEHGLEYALTKVGWRPASELPPVDENGNSQELFAIDIFGCFEKVYYHKEDEDGLAYWAISRHNNNLPELIFETKWWCYLPDEK